MEATLLSIEQLAAELGLMYAQWQGALRHIRDLENENTELVAQVQRWEKVETERLKAEVERARMEKHEEAKEPQHEQLKLESV